MKSFTDISQSKTLAKILQFKSADMSYIAIIEDYTHPQKIKEYKLTVKDECFNPRYDIPAWSLAALLEIMPHVNNIRPFNLTKMWEGGEYNREHVKYVCTYYYTHNTESDNPIDACVEMIIYLKEKELI